MLGYSCDTHSGAIELESAQSMIDFHTRFSFRAPINFYFNLQYDFEGMLKLFKKDIAMLLYGSSEAYLDDKLGPITVESIREDNVRWKYKINYIPKKAFHIKKKGDKKYSFYDLMQYYQTSLNKAAEAYLTDNAKDDFKAEFTSKNLFLGKTTIPYEIERFRKYIQNNPLISEKDKIKKIDEMVSFFNRFNSPNHYKEILTKYCIKDADICRKLGHIIVDGINTFVNTKNFNSSATISEYYFRSNGLIVPKMAPSIYQNFMRAYYGGRFENMKKGFLKNVSIYDIKSAYPYAMRDMPILSKKPIIKNSYNYHEEALYGTYCISVKIPEDTYISPLPVRESLLYFPNGEFKEYFVDKLTLKTLLDNNYDVTLHKAMEIYDDDAEPLLYDLILKLFNIKEDKKNQPEVVRLAAKIILNSLYGKFIQLVDDTGLQLIREMEELDSVSPAELFNIANRYYKRIHTLQFKTGKLFSPHYAAYITAHTRNYLFNTAKRVGFHRIIGFHTDSIMLQGNQLIETGHNLGDWELESLKDKRTKTSVAVEDAELHLLKSGFYQVRRNGLSKLRSRGIGYTDNLLQKEFVVKRRLGLRQAIKGSRSFEDMNIISNQVIINNVDGDAKRVWDSAISLQDMINGRMIDSMPVVI